MANYTNLINSIKAVIKQNGTNDITGQLMQDTLTTIVGTLGRFAQFAGVAIPSTNPGNPDQTVFYLATQVGTYVNFNGVTISGTRICAIHNVNGAWELVVIITLGDGSAVEIDPVLDPTSLNPVENRAVYAECQAIRALISGVPTIQKMETSDPTDINGLTFSGKLILSFTAAMSDATTYYQYFTASQKGSRLNLCYADINTHEVSYERLDGNTDFSTLLGSLTLSGDIVVVYCDMP